ncbi:MAG TPA: AAA family ATPase [Bryobacteraceae bacterium]|jgi:AAA+ superfamily predicted ATPase|nr:AAA family ATPase [Bryobacteraceae bacterium]
MQTNNHEIVLSPAQAQARSVLAHGLEVGSICVLSGETGSGKSIVLRHLHREIGGALLKIADLLDVSSKRHPLLLEKALFDVVFAALKQHATVIADDFHLLFDAFCCNHFYPRTGWMEAPALALCTYAIETGKKLILSSASSLPNAIGERSFRTSISRFRAEDYASLVTAWLDTHAAAAINFDKIYRFAPKLNAHQLKSACDWLRPNGEITTDLFIEYLRSQRLASNVDLEEVQHVDLRDLMGVDDVLRSLEINIALPLENDQLANELNLRSKRGVLLYGPPGTGKTTVGRAFAHRLKGKFFLVDGTFIAGTGDFYNRVHHVFQAAKENAPAVIFIDDADAIFEDGEERGLYRYLLTMLDGLESESSGRVCVMLTAMDVNHLPPALVRSGRVELWLEMRLPDRSARLAILQRHLNGLQQLFPGLDHAALVEATEGFTGADLKRVVEDAKGLYAYARVAGDGDRGSSDYLMEAVKGVAANKARYAQAEAASRASSPNRDRKGVGAFGESFTAS